MKKKMFLVGIGVIGALIATAMPASATESGLSGNLRKD